jgi:hypothetical protein
MGTDTLKILIVGLTAVLSLTNFNAADFRKGIVRNQTEINFSNYHI